MNQDWYGTALQRPALQVRERIELIRRLIAHRSGPFRHEGRFDHITMAHYDRTGLPGSVTILVAGVGEHMVGVAGECADGFVGHTIAPAAYLRDFARPALARGAAKANRDLAQVRMTTQIVASVSADPRAARRDAALPPPTTPRTAGTRKPSPVTANTARQPIDHQDPEPQLDSVGNLGGCGFADGSP